MNVDELVSELEGIFKQPIWYQKLSELDYNIGCNDLIYIKVRGGIVIWRMFQYG